MFSTNTTYTQSFLVEGEVTETMTMWGMWRAMSSVGLQSDLPQACCLPAIVLTYYQLSTLPNPTAH